MRIAHYVTNTPSFPNGTDTGLWLTELTHAWDTFEKAGYEQVILSPNGGAVPLDPRSLTAIALDSSGRRWLSDPQRMALLQDTKTPQEVNAQELDALYLAGGHGVMFDFTDDAGLHQLIADMVASNRLIGAVCHGYCGLLNAKAAEGQYLIEGRNISGFSWREEQLAGVAKHIPYNAEEVAKQRGANFQKSPIPFAPFVVRDGNVITGQNPFSARKTARMMVQALSE